MRKLASIQTVNAVEPIPNTDAIERIRVLGWSVVVKKGEHQPGDKLVYREKCISNQWRNSGHWCSTTPSIGP